jgi:hypothetical protein
MPIPIPQLDDKTYEQLMEEAKSLYTRYAPRWTNHNPADPGVTLTELFATLNESAMYRLNRITMAMQWRMVQLLAPPPQAARVDCAITIPGIDSGIADRKELFFPAGLTIIANGTMRFTLGRDILLVWPDDTASFVVNGDDVIAPLTFYNNKVYANDAAGAWFLVDNQAPAYITTGSGPNQAFQLDYVVKEGNTLVKENVETLLENKPLVYSPEMFDVGNPFRWGPPTLELIDDDGNVEEWKFRADLLGSTQDDLHFTIDYHRGAIVFGDGTYGKIPAAGGKIRLRNVMLTDGMEGNIAAKSAWQLGEVQECWWENHGGAGSYIYENRADLTIENAARAFSGEDWYGSVEPKAMLSVAIARARRYHKQRHRAVTGSDYETLAQEAHADVGRASAVFNYNGKDNAPEENAVTVYIVEHEGADDPAETVKAYLRPRIPAATRLYVKEMKRYEVFAYIYVKYQPHVTGDDAYTAMSNKIIAKLRSYFDPVTGGMEGKGLMPGEPVRKAEVFQIIEELEGVDYVDDLILTPEPDQTRDPYALTVLTRYNESIIVVREG